MLIPFGTNFQGSVDEVPGFFWVETKFYHVGFMPLVPLGTWAVTRRVGNGRQGVKIPMSIKSILMAWIAYLSAVVGLIGSCIALSQYLASDTHWLPCAITGGIAAVIWLVVKYLPILRRASYTRACQIAKHLQMTPDGLSRLAAAYGKPAPTNLGTAPPR
jgi:hypothetical protein